MTSKAIYTVATINGHKHDDVIGYIACEFGKTSTRDLTEEEKQSLIKHLDKDKQMAEKKTYIGSGKKQHDGWIKATLKAELLKPEHWEEYKGVKYVRVNISILNEPDKFGKDVQITLDTWKPDGTGATPLSEAAQDFNDSQSQSPNDDTELSF